MGQQQLLLLVIGVIIVGFAVIAGLTAAETKFKQGIADTLIERNLTIAAEAVFWKTKMDPFNGGDAQYTNLEDGGMDRLFMGETTNEGTFKITKATADSLEITAVSVRFPTIGARTFVYAYSIDSTKVRYDGTYVIE